MISVVHVVVTGEIGGAERMLVDLASHPDESHARHTIALMTPSDRVAKLFRDAGIRVIDRGRVAEGPLPYLWRSLGPVDVRWLTKVFRAEHCDIAQLHTIGSHVVGTRAALRAKTEIVRTEHGTESYTDRSVWPFSGWALRYASSIVAVSDSVRAVAIRKAPFAKDRITVIRNGVDTDHFAWAPLPEGATTFAVVGRLGKLKGVDIAIDAMREVTNARLLIIGDGSERDRLMARVRGTLDERVTFVGWADDVREPLARAHFVLLSSRSEGLGIALLEGMAMGRPAVAVPTGGIPEIVRPGETGFLARDASPSALAAAMREAMACDLPALSTKARAFAVTNASVSTLRKAYGAVYEELVSRPDRPER